MKKLTEIQVAALRELNRMGVVFLRHSSKSLKPFNDLVRLGIATRITKSMGHEFYLKNDSPKNAIYR